MAVVRGEILPGAWVRHPDRPDWGRGQIQSVVGARITVNFEHAGKLLIDGSQVQLEPYDPDDASSQRRT